MNERGGEARLSGEAALSVQVFPVREGRILLTRRGPDLPYAPGLWHAGVAGKVEPGEDVVTAALRESAEELDIGVSADDLRFVHVVHDGRGPRGWVHFFFLCHEWTGVPRNREPHKHDEIRWWSPDEPPVDMVDYCAAALRRILAGEVFSRRSG